MQEEPERKEGLMGPAGAQWLIDAIREQGGLAILAHPYWSGLSLGDVQGLRDHLGLEVYNADTEVHIGRGNSQALWDDLLTRGLAPLAVAVDDCHRPGQDSLRAWTTVRAPDRAPESIMAALRAGHFYASTGPGILDVRWEPDAAAGTDDEPAGGTVSVRCSPVRSVTLVADATKGGRLNAGAFGMALRARRLRPSGHNPEGVSDGSLLTGGEFFPHREGALRPHPGGGRARPAGLDEPPLRPHARRRGRIVSPHERPAGEAADHALGAGRQVLSPPGPDQEDRDVPGQAALAVPEDHTPRRASSAWASRSWRGGR